MRGPRRRRLWRAPLEVPCRRHAITRFGFTGTKNTSFWTIFQMQFGGRMTKKKFKKSKKSERNVKSTRECAEIRHTVALSLDVPTRDRGFGGISSEDFSWARSAFVHNAIVRSLSHGEVPCHRPWTFRSISQELTRNANSESETP